uniref:Ig-like domain-containing protein n=1 Tax=Lates calcarifer TaxID=8187 RepID=A0A4W6CJT5_LATCA
RGSLFPELQHDKLPPVSYILYICSSNEKPSHWKMLFVHCTTSLKCNISMFPIQVNQHNTLGYLVEDLSCGQYLSAFILRCEYLSLYISLFVSTEPPDNVSISFRDHSGPLLEGHQYTLQCEVHNVAPVENLIVTFYRGQTALVTEIFTLNINTRKEDDGVQYWCEARLGPEGPQPPLVVMSEKFSATVNSTPAPGTTPSTSSTPTPSFSMCFMLLFFSLV